MDRNENGIPRGRVNTDSVRRDCTGNLVGSGSCGPERVEGVCTDCLDCRTQCCNVGIGKGIKASK